MKAKIILMACVGALALSAASSRGQSLNLSGATLEGSLVNQTLINSATSANDGEISTWVVSDSAIDSQGYIFIYQLQNNGPDDIIGVNFNKYLASQYVGSLSYSNVDSGSLPGHLMPSVTFTPNFTYNTITAGGAATFTGDLPMGKTSWFIAIDTDVNSFQTGYALAQDDYQAHGLILAPDAATYSTPEPSSAMILLVGSACFFAILRWRRAMD
ncbi:MAG TPA: hypothetical protein VGY56_12045 [Verrucomicrobiae bacterium]|nr:hypothetical protein [Verrucomicrobiae bacterium]